MLPLHYTPDIEEDRVIETQSCYRFPGVQARFDTSPVPSFYHITSKNKKTRPGGGSGFESFILFNPILEPHFPYRHIPCLFQYYWMDRETIYVNFDFSYCKDKHYFYTTNFISKRGEIRTHTGQGLNLMSLPIGLLAHGILGESRTHNILGLNQVDIPILLRGHFRTPDGV